MTLLSQVFPPLALSLLPWLGAGEEPVFAQEGPAPSTQGSPLASQSESVARAQALLVQLRDHLVPPRHRLGVDVEVQSMALFHGPRPGSVRERVWAKNLRVFSGRFGWEIDEFTTDAAAPGSKGTRSRYRGFTAERPSEYGLRENVEDMLAQYAVFPEALVGLLERFGAVGGIVEGEGEIGILVEIPGAEVLLRTVELEYGGETVPGLVGVDWLVHDELLGDVVGRLDYDEGPGPFSGVAAGFRITGPMGEWSKVKVTAVEDDTGTARFDGPTEKSPESAEGPGDVKLEWEVLGEDLFEIRVLGHEARVLALALPEGWAVMEAPVSTGVGRAILRELKKERPGLGVAYVLASHHHPHYVGAMRPFVAEGAAIVCPEGVVSYVEELLYRPRTLFPDRLAREIHTERQKEPRIIGVAKGDRWSPDELGARLVAVEAAGESQHTDDFMVFFLPQHRLAFGGDLLWLPAEGQRRMPSPRTKGLASILERAGLPVDEFMTSWPVIGREEARKKGPGAWRDRAPFKDIQAEARRGAKETPAPADK